MYKLRTLFADHPELPDERNKSKPEFARIPRHVGLIPDGNRRWARQNGLPVADGYIKGAVKGIEMLKDCFDLGIEEVSVYGFTQDNNKRPKDQRLAFGQACVEFVRAASAFPVAL